ncbi:MAG: HAD family phosphatase [Burkholderiales bacterium]|nr:HAD family phosphatase [Burkholderiales bacterium]MDE1928628.1 HAD family phosphatase [Burkholderiales bacterium]MDE2160859.1 HAD family phosphatase [Burkholderiales bacterium]MDE2501642.1 HAD family phosphatase [Burkholderiales bacterium]
MSKTIVFDFGGVLFEWRPARLLQRALPHHAVDDASAALWARRFFQDYQGDWGEFDRGRLGLAELVPRIAARTGLAADEVRGVIAAIADELQPRTDTVALLRRLHGAGHALHFLSNMPAPYADHLDATHDFLGCFASGVYSGRVGLVKPEPAIYELAARRFGAPVQQLVFLDDHEPNVVAARACGWQALQFTDAARAERELRERGWI